MFDNRRRMTSKAFLTASVLFLTPAFAKSQEAKSAATPNASSSSADLTSEVRALVETVRELQAQVQALHSQLSELRAKVQGTGTDAPAPGTEREPIASSHAAVPTHGVGDPYTVFLRSGAF
jgi:uncharacterized protein YlxW (UPF0749 family)